jgi:hypothetical protein
LHGWLSGHTWFIMILMLGLYRLLWFRLSHISILYDFDDFKILLRLTSLNTPRNITG